ncbi:hypothetical protein Tco_1202912 [Tanacetum coccineum]
MAKNANNKGRWGSKQKSNHVQQLPPKRQNVERIYTVRSNEKNAYAGNLPYYNKCRLHHARPCIVNCNNCKRVGHMTKRCRTFVSATNQRAPIAN